MKEKVEEILSFVCGAWAPIAKFLFLRVALRYFFSQVDARLEKLEYRVGEIEEILSLKL